MVDVATENITSNPVIIKRHPQVAIAFIQPPDTFVTHAVIHGKDHFDMMIAK
jgi:hypothetical protein